MTEPTQTKYVRGAERGQTHAVTNDEGSTRTAVIGAAVLVLLALLAFLVFTGESFLPAHIDLGPVDSDNREFPQQQREGPSQQPGPEYRRASIESDHSAGRMMTMIAVG